MSQVPAPHLAAPTTMDIADAEATASASRYAWYVLFILTLVQVVNYVDRQIIPPLLKPIQDELGLSNTAVGFLGTAFMLVHALTAIPLGMLADRMVRRKIIAVGIGFWSLATAGAGLASSYGHLLLARGAVGIGEAAYAPAATSLLSDMFPARMWAKVIGIFNLGLVVGAALGLVLGGVLSEKIGWRACFFVVGLPGLLLTVIVWLFREPPRSHLTEPAKWADMIQVLHIRSFWLVIAGAASVTFAAGALVHFLPKLVTEVYSVPSSEAALRLTPIVIAAFLGVITGGVVADWLQYRFAAGRALTMAVAFLLGAPFLYWGLYAPTLGQFITAGFIATFFMSFYHGPVAAIVTDLVPPSLRATAIAFYMFAIHILGDMPSPVIVGFLSDVIAGEQASAAVMTEALRHSMVLCVVATALSGIIFAGVAPVLRRRALVIESVSRLGGPVS
ncbi:MAG: spinster family MFS transporter [Acidobacteriota bacterium]